MRSDKETKKWFKVQASSDPDKYYATGVLRKEGFRRASCTECGMWFWTVQEGREICGDPSCSGGFKLFEQNPARNKMTYVGVWQEFKAFFSQKGYKVMPRYPVVARWNPTMEYTIASIAAFQPHVVNGEADPPARSLVIPQFCLRFGDIDNVGITGSHLTGFVMIGQHMFVPPDEWDQNKAFEDLFSWFIEVMGLPKEELIFHEDAWAGGGNYGPCMEFFSRGVELCNQVYMLYEQTPEGDRELSLKVLDMGLGMERCAWFSQGAGTAYDATFPGVIGKILERTGHVPDKDLQRMFLPKAAYLNIDEIENIQEAWVRVADELGVSAVDLRAAIEPMQAIYSVAEHARSLLFALTDGALPSNTGGGYNLRTIFRRAQSFIDRFGWDLDLGEVAAWHAEELEEFVPGLLEGIEETREILAVEKRKHYENIKRARSIVQREVKRVRDGRIPTERLIELYDSDGISPDTLAREAKKEGLSIEVPDNFYKLVSERHERQEQKTATRKERHFPLEDVPRTLPLYFKSYDLREFTGTVIRILDDDWVVLDQTAFYPTSGGQEHDLGVMVGQDGTEYPVVDVAKQGGTILHKLSGQVALQQGETVTGKIDWERRRQLAQHHTATHIINGAARKVLGNHVWQAGAAKTTEKARIDITHYESLTDDEIGRIEEEANRIVDEDIALDQGVVSKQLAEERHGFRLYQGGAVPGKEIRVVNIPDFDAEACGGTHLNSTGEAGKIKILKSTKIQDGIVRLEYVAGEQAEKHLRDQQRLLDEVKGLLGVEDEYLPSAAEALFAKWKKARKGRLAEWEDPRLEQYEGDALARTAEVLKTQPENVPKTIRRFQADIADAGQSA